MCTNVSTLPCNHGSCNHAELPAEGKSARSKRGPDGILVAKDLSGKKVGEYDPDNDVTRDGRGRKVGVGDQLSWLLSSDR